MIDNEIYQGKENRFSGGEEGVTLLGGKRRWNPLSEKASFDSKQTGDRLREEREKKAKAEKKKAIVSKGMALFASAVVVAEIAGMDLGIIDEIIDTFTHYVCGVCQTLDCRFWENTTGRPISYVTVSKDAKTYASVSSMDNVPLMTLPSEGAYNTTLPLILENGRRVVLATAMGKLFSSSAHWRTFSDLEGKQTGYYLYQTDSSGKQHGVAVELVYAPDGEKPENEHRLTNLENSRIEEEFEFCEVIPCDEPGVWIRSYSNDSKQAAEALDLVEVQDWGAPHFIQRGTDLLLVEDDSLYFTGNWEMSEGHFYTNQTLNGRIYWTMPFAEYSLGQKPQEGTANETIRIFGYSFEDIYEETRKTESEEETQGHRPMFRMRRLGTIDCNDIEYTLYVSSETVPGMLGNTTLFLVPEGNEFTALTMKLGVRSDNEVAFSADILAKLQTVEEFFAYVDEMSGYHEHNMEQYLKDRLLSHVYRRGDYKEKPEPKYICGICGTPDCEFWDDKVGDTTLVVRTLEQAETFDTVSTLPGVPVLDLHLRQDNIYNGDGDGQGDYIQLADGRRVSMDMSLGENYHTYNYLSSTHYDWLRFGRFIAYLGDHYEYGLIEMMYVPDGPIPTHEELKELEPSILWERNEYTYSVHATVEGVPGLVIRVLIESSAEAANEVASHLVLNFSDTNHVYQLGEDLLFTDGVCGIKGGNLSENGDVYLLNPAVPGRGESGFRLDCRTYQLYSEVERIQNLKLIVFKNSVADIYEEYLRLAEQALSREHQLPLIMKKLDDAYYNGIRYSCYLMTLEADDPYAGGNVMQWFVPEGNEFVAISVKSNSMKVLPRNLEGINTLADLAPYDRASNDGPELIYGFTRGAVASITRR